MFFCRAYALFIFLMFTTVGPRAFGGGDSSSDGSGSSSGQLVPAATAQSTATSLSTATRTQSTVNTSLSRSSSTTQTPSVTQASAQSSASSVNQIGSEQASSLGLVTCAEAAITIQADPPTSGALMGSCVNSFASAQEMKSMEITAAENAGQKANAALTANDSALNLNTSNEIFSDLEKQYGVTKDAFVSKVMATNGDPNALRDPELLNELFKGKITPSQIDDALASVNGLSLEKRKQLINDSRISGLADEIQNAQGRNPSSITDVNGSKLPSSNFRDKLRDTLNSQNTASPSETHAKWNTGNNAPAENNGELTLTPLSDPLFSSNTEQPASSELTLFAVVHKKYEEKFEMMKAPRLR